ncbi:hypothetical protein H4R26_003184 [Coemansia thaxteri]|uniref:Uncharacterized protein n=1 Tax=Coemansia thaxteri TaxID=2663907 RepID=A0A9W8BJI9_9FUNG|nr:hypothetical protein H4R26_003184 [Coemansia thaxteri]
MNENSSAVGPYTVDIDAVCSDYVKQVQIVTGYTESDASRLLFVKAASIVAEDAQVCIVLVECQSREHLAASIRDETIVDSSGLDRIIVRYTPTFDMLRALLAAWHYHFFTEGTGAEVETEGGIHSEAGFLVWSKPGENKQQDDTRTPDYLFIDGIGAVASDSR